ncbi:MAG: galactose-1-phosphate uridylyltransferase [Acidimicrobiia bacterium]|nr:galactose-1-phosphate uridylyltransferase [Acidimicrobiia bacterium]
MEPPDAAALAATGDVRIDPLTGAVVVITGPRQSRPDLSAPSASAADCPFCPGGLEAPEPYETRWFPNRWPPLPDGRAELLLYAPEHDASLWSLGVDGVVKVLRLWSERTAAQGARPEVAYVLVFENRGPAVGATVAHPHGQLYAFGFVPPTAAVELARTGDCPLCGEPDPALAVSRAGARAGKSGQGAAWQAGVPAAASWPFELLVSPIEHLPDLPAAEPGFEALAAVLVDALARLDQLFDAPMPYMLWWHQRPTDGGAWPSAHLHAHVAPLLRGPGTVRYVAAAEQGGGVLFNPVVPEEAAARLRSQPGHR